MGGSDSSATVQITGTILVIAIMVLFMVVVFILFLHLYAKWFWWHIDEPSPPPPTGSRRRRRRPLVFSPDQEIQVRNGLDLAVLKSLPIVVFQAEDFKDGLECAVCLCEVEEGEKARLLPKCNHGFHVECIDMWFQSHSTCPLCRSRVAPLPSRNGGPGTDVHDRRSLEGETVESLEEVLASGSSSEPASFPTNVLVWGDESQVSTSSVNGGGASLCLGIEESTSGTLDSRRHSFSASSSRLDGVIVVDIPEQMSENVAGQEASKSHAPTRMRSFRRLLSWERRAVAPSCSSSSEEA